MTRAKHARCITCAKHARELPDAGKLIGCASDAADLVRSLIANHEQEHFYVLAINVRNQLVTHELIALGTLSSVAVHPRDVFRTAIRLNAAGIVIAHNHPSGDPTPSTDDLALTKRLREVGATVGIPVVDHVVVSQSGYRSIAETMGSDFE